MIVPTPIEQLPGFDSAGNGQPGSNPWLKFIIAGGILLVVAVSVAVIRNRQNRIKKTKEQPWESFHPS